MDTSDTLQDVREKYVNELRRLMNIQSDLHAPPVVRLVWDKEVFRGVVGKSERDLHYCFVPTACPCERNWPFPLRNIEPSRSKSKSGSRRSPDVQKSYTVVRGDTIGGVAFETLSRCLVMANYRAGRTASAIRCGYPERADVSET